MSEHHINRANKRAHEALLRSMVARHPDYRFNKCLRVGEYDMSCEIYLKGTEWRIHHGRHPPGSYQVITAEESLRAWEGYGIDV